jgi:hypothetical protein
LENPWQKLVILQRLPAMPYGYQRAEMVIGYENDNVAMFDDLL